MLLKASLNSKRIFYCLFSIIHPDVCTVDYCISIPGIIMFYIKDERKLLWDEHPLTRSHLAVQFEDFSEEFHLLFTFYLLLLSLYHPVIFYVNLSYGNTHFSFLLTLLTPLLIFSHCLCNRIWLAYIIMWPHSEMLRLSLKCVCYLTGCNSKKLCLKLYNYVTADLTDIGKG